MSRTLTAELKITSPTDFDKSFPVKITNPILDDLAVQGFEAEGVKNDDGTISISEPFEADLPVTVVKALHIVEHIKISGDLIATLSAETS